MTVKWLPTSQDITEMNNDRDVGIFNLVSWIIYPKGKIAINGRVKLLESNAEKVSQVAKNIISLLQNATLAMDQNLLSLTMHRKAGSSNVINTLHHLHYGTSYSEKMFAEDMWAARTQQKTTLQYFL